jgi:hypothetical protein
MATAQRVLALYQEEYFDFNLRYFHEKLREQEEFRTTALTMLVILDDATITPGEPVDKSRLTQVGRALKELGVQMDPGRPVRTPAGHPLALCDSRNSRRTAPR